MEKNKVFPIVIKEIKDRLRMIADKDVEQMNSNVARIEKQGKEFSMTSIEELTKKSADGWIKAELSESLKQLKDRFNGIIGSDSTIAEYQKKYSTIEQVTGQHTEAIRCLLEKYEGMWRKGKEGFCLDETLLDKKLTKDSEWQPTCVQEQYYSLLQSVQKALDDLLQFEKKNDLKPFVIFGHSGAELFGCKYEFGRWNIPDTIKITPDGFQKFVFWGRICEPISTDDED